MTPSRNIAPHEVTLEIPGLELAARIWGPEDGRRVLCLHGWLDSAATFDRLAPLLPGHRLVCIDLPGHGRSGHRHDTASYDYVYWIPDVLAAADALGWKRFSIIGHSMGASVGICLAGTAPDRVERIVMIDGLGPLVTSAGDAPARLAASISQRRRPRRLSIYPDLATAADHKRRAIPGLSEEAAAILAGRDTVEVQGGVTWRHDPVLKLSSMLRLTEDHVRAFMQRVTCPVLVVRPGDGWPVEDRELKGRLSYLSRAELIMVDGCHHVHLVTPENMARQVGEFLEDTRER